MKLSIQAWEFKIHEFWNNLGNNQIHLKKNTKVFENPYVKYSILKKMSHWSILRKKVCKYKEMPIDW